MYTTQLASMVKTSNHTQKDTTVNAVFKTNDYAKFTKLNGNRDLNQLHYKRLLASVNEKNLLSANPILVNEKYQIIDGQHRFEVCKELCLPVYYILVQNLGLKEIQILNANSKNWKHEDYVDGYCSLGLKEYCYLQNELKRTGLGIASLLAMLGADNGNAAMNLREGNLILPHKKRGLIIMQWIKDYDLFFINSTHRNFIRALVHLYNIKEYNHNKMIQKLQYQSGKLKTCTDTKTYLAILEEIYNFKERSEKLRFF
jgi:hypothetical protein